MFDDQTQAELRQGFVAQNNGAVQSDDKAAEQQRLEQKHGVGNVWDLSHLQAEFTIKSFQAPFCIVTRKVDGVKGAVEFQHQPRLYFNFQPI